MLLLMIQFSSFMIMFCVIYTDLENMLKLTSLNLTVQISHSASADHLDTINGHLIYITSLQSFSTCMSLIHICVPTYANVPIGLDHVTTQKKCYLDF